MKKRIIVCCDGTWNTPDAKENGASCASNVAKIAELISPVGKMDGDEREQITYYHEGVGTGDLKDKITGGAFGVGISKNIQDCYRFLVSNYLPEDEIWLFGFSRGAYTARSIVGLIRNSGLLTKENLDMLPEAYRLYRDRSDRTHPNSDKAKKFRNYFSLPDGKVDIHFLGVWDTVGSLGVPGFLLHELLDDQWEFHDVTLSSIVKNAYHALAIDEQREDFRPCLWDAPAGTAGEQVWFPGAHSDVGGGYAESALSDCALSWMMCKAENCGLAFDAINVPIKPDCSGMLHESKKGFFETRGTFVRKIDQPLSIAATERIKGGSYQPKNLPGNPVEQACMSKGSCPKEYRCF